MPRDQSPGAASVGAGLAAAFLAADFLAVAFLAVAFLAPDFLAGVFLAAALVPPRFFLGAGPAARLSASSSAARSRVISSIDSPRGMVRFTVPSVRYGPNRPSLITMVSPVAGSGPTSRNGSALRWPRRCLGWAKRATASSTVTEKSWSSDSRLRLSLPFLRYGP